MYWSLATITQILFKSFFWLKVSGRSNVPLRGGVILASNHLSYVDPVFVGAAVGKRKLFYTMDHSKI